MSNPSLVAHNPPRAPYHIVNVISNHHGGARLLPPVGHEQVSSTNVFGSAHQRNMAGCSPISYTGQLGESCRGMGTNGGPAQQPDPTGWGHTALDGPQSGRQTSPRPAATARRWLTRINAIPETESRVGTSPRGNNTAEEDLHPTVNSGDTQPATQSRSRRRAAQRWDWEGDRQNDELIQRGLVRGFQVLWHRGK
jgi:hypothetical protein